MFLFFFAPVTICTHIGQR